MSWKKYKEREIDIDTGEDIQDETTSETSSFEKQFLELIEAFKPIHEQWAAMKVWKGQREAAKRLIDLYGFEKVKAVIAVLPKLKDDKYAPRITDLATLEKKFQSLKEYVKKNKTEKQWYEDQ